MDGDASPHENPISPVPTDDEFLRVVTDRIPVRVGYVDHDFRYVFLNGEYERMFGFAPREAWGKTVREIVGDHAWNIAESHIRRALAGEAHTQEFTTRYAFGERRVEARYVPDFGPDGNVRGVVVNALDVTARYQVEQALRTSEERYRTIFESIDEGFCVIEMIFDDGDRPVDFRYLETNPAFQRLTGMPHDTVASGKTIREIVPEYEQGWIDFYGQVALTGEAARVMDEVKGLNRWFEVSAARIGNPTKRLVAVVFNDITARKRAEQEQVRLLSELSMEREKLRTVFEQAPAFLALLRGNDFVFEYTNEAYASLIGHRDVVGKPVLEALPEVADQGFGDLLANVVNTGEPFVGREVPIFLQRTPDSTPEERYLDFVYQPVRDGGEEVYGVLAHGVDVTDQVMARRLVAQSEEQFRTVFENAPDAILVMDKNLELLGWNPAAERITGWNAAEAIGQSAAIIFTPEDRAVGLPSREAAVAAREGKSIDERWHCRRDGERFWGSGTMNALFHADGTLRGFLKVFRDATERYEMERQIREMNEQLEIRVADRTRELRDTVRETEAFNYSISHDLRAPLRAISATSRILLEDLGPGLDSEYRDLLSRQAFNASRLGRLIDELLRLSRLARVEVNREAIDMTAKAYSVAAELDSTRSVEVAEGMRASGDRNLVRTVLQNLIGNAFKFSPADSVVTVGQTDAVFWVRDRGIGFDMAYAPKIFLPFERLVTEGEFEGTGIGLANVERIVKRHGGRVWAESEPGHGATFYFTLG